MIDQTAKPHRVDPGRFEVRANGSGFVCEWVSKANNGPQAWDVCPIGALERCCRFVLARLEQVKQ